MITETQEQIIVNKKTFKALGYAILVIAVSTVISFTISSSQMKDQNKINESTLELYRDMKNTIVNLELRINELEKK